MSNLNLSNVAVLTLQLIPFNEASKEYVSANRHAVNISIPITKGSKTLAFIAKHYSSKWGGVPIRFHASQPAGEQKSFSWGPSMDKEVTVEALFKSVIGTSSEGPRVLTLRYEVLPQAFDEGSRDEKKAKKPMSKERSTERIKSPSTAPTEEAPSALVSVTAGDKHSTTHPWNFSSFRAGPPSLDASQVSSNPQSSMMMSGEVKARPSSSIAALAGIGAESQLLLDLLSGPSNLCSLALPPPRGEHGLDIRGPSGTLMHEDLMAVAAAAAAEAAAAVLFDPQRAPSTSSESDPNQRLTSRVSKGRQRSALAPLDLTHQPQANDHLRTQGQKITPRSLPAASCVPKPDTKIPPLHLNGPPQSLSIPFQPLSAFRSVSSIAQATNPSKPQHTISSSKVQPSTSSVPPKGLSSKRWIDHPMLHRSGIPKTSRTYNPLSTSPSAPPLSLELDLSPPPLLKPSSLPNGSTQDAMECSALLCLNENPSLFSGLIQALEQQGGALGSPSSVPVRPWASDELAIHQVMEAIMRQQHEEEPGAEMQEDEGKWAARDQLGSSEEGRSPDSVIDFASGEYHRLAEGLGTQKGESSGSKRQRAEDLRAEIDPMECNLDINGTMGQAQPTRVIRRKSNIGHEGVGNLRRDKATAQKGTRKPRVTKPKAPTPSLSLPSALIALPGRKQHPSAVAHQNQVLGRITEQPSAKASMPPPPPPLAASPKALNPQGYRLISKAFDELSNAMCSRLSLLDGFLSTGEERGGPGSLPHSRLGLDMMPGSGTVGWIEGAAFIKGSDPTPSLPVSFSCVPSSSSAGQLEIAKVDTAKPSASLAAEPEEVPLWTFSPIVTRKPQSRGLGNDYSLGSGLGGDEAVDFMDFGLADSLFGPMGGVGRGLEKKAEGKEEPSSRPFAALFGSDRD